MTALFADDRSYDDHGNPCWLGTKRAIRQPDATWHRDGLHVTTWVEIAPSTFQQHIIVLDLAETFLHLLNDFYSDPELAMLTWFKIENPAPMFATAPRREQRGRSEERSLNDLLKGL